MYEASAINLVPDELFTLYFPANLSRAHDIGHAVEPPNFHYNLTEAEIEELLVASQVYSDLVKEYLRD